MNTQQHQQIIQPNKTHMLLIKIMSKRRTWVALFVLVYGIILFCSLNLLQSILIWYNTTLSPSTLASTGGLAAAAYASAMLGAVFGVMSMAAALAVAIPAMVVTWITILVLLAFCGKSRRGLLVEGRKLSSEISGVVIKILFKEGNLVAVVCAVLVYFLIVKKSSYDDEF